jgi:cbb3-type cytochrome oxidase subunit 1
LIIVCAAVTLIFGITSGKEYAELEWPIDIMITSYLGGIRYQHVRNNSDKKRKTPLRGHLVFHCYLDYSCHAARCKLNRNSGFTFKKLQCCMPGVQDALVQWWYGHNAVAFFLTTPYLGLMYYFLAKGSQPSGVFLPSFYHSLLGPYFPLYMGWTSPLALHCFA